MCAVPFFEGEFRYRIVDRRGEIIEITNGDFKMRMWVEDFERYAAIAAAVIAQDRLRRLKLGEIVRLPASIRAV